MRKNIMHKKLHIEIQVWGKHVNIGESMCLLGNIFLNKKFIDIFWEKEVKLENAMAEHLLRTCNIYYTKDSYFLLRKAE